MPLVTIENLSNATIDLSTCHTSLLLCLLESGHDWMHACGGKGRCTTCKVAVLSGMNEITPLSPAEERYRREGSLLNHERLTCQVRVRGEVIIKVPSASKLPHITYSDD
jgi:ferredoxin, 2Fe-2S